MALNNRGKTTLKNALQSMGLFEGSVDSQRPDKSCVAVALAYMEYFENVRELWRDTFHKDHENTGLNSQEVWDLLEQAGLADVAKKDYLSAQGQTAYYRMLNDSTLGTKYTLPQWEQQCLSQSGYSQLSGEGFLDDSMLVLYNRPNGTAHCVNMYRLESGGPYLIRDFQNDIRGEDVTNDLRNAVKISVLEFAGFHESPPYYTRTNARARRKSAMQRKRSEVIHQYGYNPNRFGY
jgi:hypothetical protein